MPLHGSVILNLSWSDNQEALWKTKQKQQLSDDN